MHRCGVTPLGIHNMFTKKEQLPCQLLPASASPEGFPLLGVFSLLALLCPPPPRYPNEQSLLQLEGMSMKQCVRGGMGT